MKKRPEVSRGQYNDKNEERETMNAHRRMGLILGICLCMTLGLLLPSASGPQDPGSAVVPGQTATLLPDGRWLMIGGEGPKGPLSSAVIWDPKTQSSTPIGDPLLYPRAYHSATLLPGGTVLILGGIGSSGEIVAQPERLNLQLQRFEALPVDGLTPRAYHTATLLTDGRLLIAGGVSAIHETLEALELWDFRTERTEPSSIRLLTPRSRHSAVLQADGTVLLWGGVNSQEQPLNNGEIYDPATQLFTAVKALPPASPIPDTQPPFVEASLPLDHASEVPVDTLIALRFSEPLRVETLNAGTVTLIGPEGQLRVNVIPAEEGMLVFLTAEQPLQQAVTYTVSLNGPTDRAGLPLSASTLSFTTVQAVQFPAAESEEWIPGTENFGGNWRSGRSNSPWQTLSPLQAEPGVTAVAGQALTLTGRPLANVTLSIENTSTRTDDSGRFLLRSIPSGPQILVIDGRSASWPGKTYGLFEVGVNIVERQTTVLPYTVWMPVIDTAHAVSIPSPTTEEVVITTPRIPGLEVHIAPQTVIRGRDGRVVTSISITPVPVDRPPFPLASGVQVPIYFTIQPGGANLETLNSGNQHGARIIYPNYINEPPGTRINFWTYEPSGQGWYVYGQGTVTADGKQIAPDPGVAIFKFTGAMISWGTPPSTWPPAGNDRKDGEPVDLASGLFVMTKTDLHLPDLVPITLTRTYRPGDTVSRPFGIGTNHSYGIYLNREGTQYQEADLILPDGGRIHYTRISPGTTYVDAVYEHTATPTVFYKSTLFWNGYGWDLKLKDGTVYVFGDMAPLQAIRDRYGNQITLTWTYGTFGNITRITSTNGRWVEFTYDAGDRITQAKDNMGRTVNYAYDASGRLFHVTDPNGGVTEYTYDASHRILTLKDTRGIVYLTNAYDANGRVSLQTQADDSTYQFAYTLDGNGKVTQTDVTDPRGKIRRATFNADGYALTDTRALGQPEQQTTTYERETGTNFISSATDALGRRTDYTYDTKGNVTGVTRLAGTPDAVTTNYTYEPIVNHFTGLTFEPILTRMTGLTDPLGHTTTFTYDLQGNLTAITDPLGHQTTLSYALSRPTAITDALGNVTQFAYDQAELASVADPLGHSTTRLSDSVGRLRSLIDPLGRLTRYDYDALNRLTTLTDPLNGATAFSYDPNGNLLSVTDARNNVTGYTYNSMDRLATRVDPLENAESYGYDGSGNLTTFTDRKGQATNFTYDALNRRTLVTYDDSSTTAYTYDAGNRVTQIVDSVSGTITRSYDGLDRLTQETTPQGTVSYTYDAAGRRTGMTVAGQPTVNYTYDDANRLTQITQDTATVSFAYDNANRRTSVTLPNSIVQSYTYDAASRVTGITYTLGQTTLGNLTYTYDAAGNRTQIGGSWARTGLPQAVASATYNAANQLTNWAGTTLIYDDNGNLTDDGTNTYTWDARNRLASMTGASFTYDPLGRRTTKTVNGTTTDFLYDRQNPIQELTGTTPITNLLPGLGIDEFFTRTDSSGARSLLRDALGSTLALTGNTGTVQTSYNYEPFGKATTTGEASGNSFQYTARENDDTGLDYYRARYYSPPLERFISEDSLACERKSGKNLYSYVSNNPIRYVDPSGFGVGVPACDDYDRECKRRRGSKSGDPNDDPMTAYACKAGNCCRDFGESPEVNCTRECLLNWFKVCSEFGGMGCIDITHVYCWLRCGCVGECGRRLPESCRGLRPYYYPFSN
jgi:RHS repeat-associated protein